MVLDIWRRHCAPLSILEPFFTDPIAAFVGLSIHPLAHLGNHWFARLGHHALPDLLPPGAKIAAQQFGRWCTQTGDAADFRTPDEVYDPYGQPGPYSVISVIADGIDNVRRAACEELPSGASQLRYLFPAT